MFRRFTMAMNSGKGRDVAGIFTLLAIGIFVIAEARGYAWGSLAYPGPALMPTLTGGFLLLMAGMLSLEVVFRRSEYEADKPMLLRPLLLVPASIAAFAVLIESRGLIPAISVSIVVATMADEKPSLIRIVILAVSGSLLSILVFVYALGLPIRIWR